MTSKRVHPKIQQIKKKLIKYLYKGPSISLLIMPSLNHNEWMDRAKDAMRIYKYTKDK